MNRREFCTSLASLVGAGLVTEQVQALASIPDGSAVAICEVFVGFDGKKIAGEPIEISFRVGDKELWTCEVNPKRFRWEAIAGGEIIATPESFNWKCLHIEAVTGYVVYFDETRGLCTARFDGKGTRLSELKVE